MKNYRDLNVWKKSVDFVVKIYEISSYFPKSEQYGITAQMRRAAVSVPSNIAEGYCRNFTKEYVRFLKIAFASGGELETQLEIVARLGFITENVHNDLDGSLSVIMKMLNNLIKSLVPKP